MTYSGVVSHSMRFAKMDISVERDHKLDVLKQFVGELLSGQRDPVVTRYFGAFASLGANCHILREIFLLSYPRWLGLRGPFELLGVQPSLDFRTIPDEYNTLRSSARKFMYGIVVDYKSPTLIYVVSANACFPAVEGFLVYIDGRSKHPRIVGFQMKTADGKPRHGMDKRVINGDQGTYVGQES